MFQIVSIGTASHKAKGKNTKVTCVTCKLKKCIGKCRFEAASCPRPPRAA